MLCNLAASGNDKCVPGLDLPDLTVFNVERCLNRRLFGGNNCDFVVSIIIGRAYSVRIAYHESRSRSYESGHSVTAVEILTGPAEHALQVDFIFYEIRYLLV